LWYLYHGCGFYALTIERNTNLQLFGKRANIFILFSKSFFIFVP